MNAHPLAGQPAPSNILVDVAKLITAYYETKPDPDDPSHRVSFGTSGHRGSSFRRSFNEPHILATTQAIWTTAGPKGSTGRSSSASIHTRCRNLLAGPRSRSSSPTASRPAWRRKVISRQRRPFRLRSSNTTETTRATATVSSSRRPTIRPKMVASSTTRRTAWPADTEVTSWIERRANQLLASGLKDVKRVPYEAALRSETTHLHDFITPYVEGLETVLDMHAISSAGLRIGVDPMGGAGIEYWPRIAERYDLRLDIVNDVIDPTFSFMTLDRDGKIRMDCSSPYAMARLVDLRNRYDIAFGNDTDFDRHGIVTSSWGFSTRITTSASPSVTCSPSETGMRKQRSERRW